jgi:hypothetical protein
MGALELAPIGTGCGIPRPPGHLSTDGSLAS